MLNQASTFWYHPHHKPSFWSDSDGTGGQVLRGLTGLIIVEDDITDNLSIPKTYGVDDIPLIIQDRAFNPDGTFKEFLNLPDLVVRTGDTMVVNGAITPTHDTHAQMIRFRILNGSNGRSYYLGFDDNRDFYQIGSDGGLLEAPIATSRLRISPAERVDIVVDFSGDLGSTIDLMSYASELIVILPTYPPLLQDGMDTLDYRIMSFDVGAVTASPIMSLPASLTTIIPFVEADAVNFGNPRMFEIENGAPLATINGASMDLNVINETIQLGDLEIWEITNTSGVAHPFHVHGEPFQVLSRSNGPVPDSEKGWKDVILVPAQQGQGNPGSVKIIKPFLDFIDSINPYMYHCHILEHEDRGMMGQYVVVDTLGIASIDALGNPIENATLFPNPAMNTKFVKVEFSTSTSDNYTLVLLNQNGEIVRTFFEDKLIDYGIHQFDLDIEILPAGAYHLTITSSQAQSVQKLIKLD
ncbi:MAG: multicopper oxidase domain-containing protein [Crocinitomicaceae bacterium]|nr:multicopper oxidase domain-containing protein [Crocinitomicaceae bacterium]